MLTKYTLRKWPDMNIPIADVNGHSTTMDKIKKVKIQKLIVH